MRAFQPNSPYARGLASRETNRGENPGAPDDTKAKREWTARWSDGFERTVRCAFCPDWSYTGTGPDSREALAEHRLERHY